MSDFKNVFSIPIYEKKDDRFEIIGETIYTITYKIKNPLKPNLQIIVNGILTDKFIHLGSSYCNPSFKSEILEAISWYFHRDMSQKYQIHTYFAPMETVFRLFSAHSRNIVYYLLPINKEISRDKISKYDLIINKI